MDASKQIYLIPEQVECNEFLCECATQYNLDPVEVEGYSIYTFLDRLDKIGFPFYAVALKKDGKKSHMYQCTFTTKPDFQSLGFTETQYDDSQIIIHISPTYFENLDKDCSAVKVKTGDWGISQDDYNSLSALHHLGIVSELPPAAFYINSMSNIINFQFRQIYQMNGDLINSLTILYKRLQFASKFFNINTLSDAFESVKSNRPFCFGSLIPYLENSPEVDFLFYSIPFPMKNHTHFYVILSSLSHVCHTLTKLGYNITNTDDFDHISSSLLSFQKDNCIPQTGFCDRRTIRELYSKCDIPIPEKLPIFESADIHFDLAHVYFPALGKLTFDSDDPLSKEVTDVINRSLEVIPDPKTKVEWMTNRIVENTNECDKTCDKLAKDLVEIDKKVAQMTGMLKEVMIESQFATSKVSAASKILKNACDYHLKVHNKFNVFRTQLFDEERKMRFSLLIGTCIAIVGTIGFFLSKYF